LSTNPTKAGAAALAAGVSTLLLLSCLPNRSEAGRLDQRPAATAVPTGVLLDAPVPAQEPPGEPPQAPPAQPPQAALVPQDPATAAFDPSAYGCPADVQLVEWRFAPVAGGGRPEGVPPWSPGSTISGVRFSGDAAAGFYTETGICTGQSGYAEDITLQDSVIERSAKWHARLRKVRANVRVLRVSDLGGPEEHDYYVEPVGGGNTAIPAFVLERGYSLRSGSQRLQVAQREWEIDPGDELPGGAIIVRDDYCVDHARAPEEGGTGTRPSQAYKFFSAQRGPDELHQHWAQLQHRVELRGIRLDDTMQQRSQGALLIGDNLGTLVEDCVFQGGELLSEAVRIEPGKGPVVIRRCHFEYASGPGGRGIQVFDLARPLLIEGCTGNLEIKGPGGERLAVLADGYRQG
jgi:hypothetical protein